MDLDVEMPIKTLKPGPVLAPGFAGFGGGQSLKGRR